MNESNLRTLIDLAVSRVESGRVSVSFDGDVAFYTEFRPCGLQVTLVTPKLIRRLVRKTPREVKKLSFLRYASSVLTEAGIDVNISDSGGPIIELGKGKRVGLRNLELGTVRVLKYM